MSTIEEVLQSQNVLLNAGCSELAILQCTGSYPTVDSDLNIGAMLQIREKTNCVIGFSDHSTGINAVSMLSWAGYRATPSHWDKFATESAQEVLEAEGVSGVIDRLEAIL